MGYTKASGESSFGSLYYNYKGNAKNRGLVFALTKEEFKKLSKMNCFYCNIEPSSIWKERYGTGNYIYNGIDRMDNDKGYILENCLTCCGKCNIMKRNHTFEDFRQHILKIYINLFQ